MCVCVTQLKEKHFQTLEDAMMEAKYREKWRAIVQDRSFYLDDMLDDSIGNVRI